MVLQVKALKRPSTSSFAKSSGPKRHAKLQSANNIQVWGWSLVVERFHCKRSTKMYVMSNEPSEFITLIKYLGRELDLDSVSTARLFRDCWLKAAEH